MKDSKFIRKAFLDFFESKGHFVNKSFSLVPANDDTLIFTNAGMVPFKDVFLGKEKKDFRRATTSQKCMRVSGKHNDLENVGKTARHHTFFEMLGNFSFGDYFKDEAIKYAWEFLTKVLKLDSDKLYVSVYKDDDEAYNIWANEVNFPKEKIFRLGDKDNFWAMGDTGPCGPCSEIHYDQGEDMSCGEHCALGACDCDRWLEIWNLVFMQFNRDKEGKFTKLPKPNIDTGMGLERIVAILQGKRSNFDSDLFRPIIEEIASLIKKEYGNNEKDDTAMRVIADHSRASSFLIADGVIPSNEARGYVLRRVMRRAIRFGYKLGFEELFFHKVCDKVIDMMSDVYPELGDNRETILKIVKNEEEKFRKTLTKGEKLLNAHMERLQDKNKDTIGGEVLFLLYDSFGFPIDLSILIAKENYFKIDEENFNKLLLEQKTKSKKNSNFKNINDKTHALLEGIQKEIKTKFVGYDKLESKSILNYIIKEDSLVDYAIADNESNYIFICKESPFYAESGGQVADKGIIKSTNAFAKVLDVQKTKQDLFYHIVSVESGEFKLNDEINLIVDQNTRENTMRNHSAAHLLQAALIKILGSHVHQEGSFVDSEKLRFDFNHFEALTHSQVQKIEKEVNHNIMLNEESIIRYMDLEDAKKEGAIALFSEKYKEEVRTIKMGSESFELCGGTHVRRTGDIGFFKVVSETSVASGIRRIEAITGDKVIKMLHLQENHERRLISILKASKSTYINKVDSLVESNKKLNLELENLKKEYNLLKLNSANSNQEEVGEFINDNFLIVKELTDVNPKDLKLIADELKQQNPNSLVVLLSKINNTYNVLMMNGNESKVHCGNILKELMQSINGRGGGRNNMAQGGAPYCSIEKINKKLRECLLEI